jgi:hypothetical protein
LENSKGEGSGSLAISGSGEKDARGGDDERAVWEYAELHGVREKGRELPLHCREEE